MSMVVTIPFIIGGLSEGISIANVFYGISVAQAYVYMKHCEYDARWLRWLAVSVVFLETGNTVFLQRQQFFYSVLSVGDPTIVAIIDWSIPAAMLFEIVSEIAVQMFYIHRMWMFSKNLTLTIGTIILLIIRHGFFMYCIADTVRYSTWIELEASKGFRPSLITTLSIIMLTDAIIAATMAYYLYRNKSPLKRTRGIVSWLIAYFVNTGAILLAISTCILVSYMVAPDSLMFGAFIMMYARALANSFFGALNARHVLRAKMEGPITLCRTSLYRSDLTSQTPGPHSAQVDSGLGVTTFEDPKAAFETSEATLNPIHVFESALPHKQHEPSIPDPSAV